ncbi:hypothetical protein NP493_2g05029 [Ridgeia piscesae]|uniref:Aquaporin n=1 Tax=Ridgeia piscesae TaxID=27915 RepID=A0AAD9ULW7_RIDPI|nr:hypothetical protein NP493_2g05029 [Ridgeia piscesae]
MKREDYFDVARTEPFSPLFWRDVLAEFIATCVLVTVQCFVPLRHGNQSYGGPVEVALAVGFVVCAMGWTVDEFGGGHMNPAVTFSMALCYRITVVRGRCRECV